MNFTYESQGAITYLVCELDAAEQVDTLTLGMLTNNHIAGLAPVLYTEMNGQRFFKYNISAKVTSEQFFGGNINKQRALQTFQNILSAICSADEYMIDPNCFSAKPEHIFLNVSSCEAALICVPVVRENDVNKEISAFFKGVMMSSQFDSNEDASYITELITYINNSAEFSVYGMKDLVTRLQSGASSPAAAPGAMNQPFVSAPVQPSVPVSSFDATITMDDMQAGMSNIPPHPPVPQSPVALVQQPPVMPPKPPVPPAPPVGMPVPPQPPVAPAPAKPPVVPPAIPVPPSPVKPPQPQVPVQPPQSPLIPGAARPITPPSGNNGVAIPGVNRATSGFAIPGVPNVPGATNPSVSQAPQQPAAEDGEKKMSIFGLLAHYNKDNVELYKKQKAEAKAKKESEAPAAAEKKAAKKKSKKSDNAPELETIPSIPSHMIPGNNPGQQQFTQPAVQPVVQPVPVQNSFNETTVLSPAMAGGETTVLGALDPSIPNPCLIRIKTGERISVNKPVFRIGKEKSYVDYFIADNIAISRSHANIHTENGEYFIEDTNSTNHTYVNGKVITSNVKTKIISGDKVKLANEDFTFLV